MREVAGIGVGVPSLVDVDRGIVYAVQNIPSWKEVHLKNALEDVFHVPVHVNNDANCFAVGECHFGKGRRVPKHRWYHNWNRIRFRNHY